MLEIKSLDEPEQVIASVDKGKSHVVRLGTGTVRKGFLEPGWRWSEHAAPLAGTRTCLAPHVGYVLSGRLKLRMDDGTEGEVGPGEAYVAGPGHDAWVIGDETCVTLDFVGLLPHGAAPWAGSAQPPSATS
jgi:quercetin dioxygenase-like cupin family protein